MTLNSGSVVRVLFGLWALVMLHGCSDTDNSLGNNAQLTVSIPSAKPLSNARAAAVTAVPSYIRTISITVRDGAENIIESGEIPASGGDLSLTVPPNLALRVTAEALDGSEVPRFIGTKDVAPLASGATTSVSLSLLAQSALNTLVLPSEQGIITVTDNTTDVTVIDTNAEIDQQIRFTITGGADGGFFTIEALNAKSAQLRFLNAPVAANPQDNNGDNVYEVQVTFTDGFESVTQNLRVSVGLWGTPDLSFGTNGIVTTDLSRPEFMSVDIARAVVVQSDGKIVVAGTTSEGSVDGSALVRYQNDGAIDPNFGTAGIVRLNGEINAMALQSNGDIIVAGTSANEGGSDFLLASFNKAGVSNWSVTTDFASLLGSESTSNERAHALVIQADDKIVVVGTTGVVNPSLLTSWDFAVARYERNGSLDASFGLKGVGIASIGIVITNIGSSYDFASAVALEAGGKIVVAGSTNVVEGDNDFVVVRYNNVGQLDTSFDTDGIVTTSFGGGDRATAVLVQWDGKIVAAGSANTDGLALARYNDNGTLDTAFGSNGKVTNPDSISESAYALLQQPDGKLIVGGTFDSCRYDCATYFGAVRYNVDGIFDTSFGRLLGSGSAETHRIAGVQNGLGTAYALAFQPNDWKLVVAGNVYAVVGDVVGANEDFGIVRFMAFPPVGCLIPQQCV